MAGCSAKTTANGTENIRYATQKGLTVLSLALPDDGHSPSESLQLCLDPLVALNVSLELVLPVRHARFWERGFLASCVAVPKAPVNEKDRTVLPKHQIRCTGKIDSMDAIA
jgi:hypothetical protein